MADVPAVTWRSLSPPARRAFEIGLAWAESGSKESPLVRSEDLLLGLDRAERAASESQQLLSHLGLRREDLVSALARGRDAPKRVKPLDELPALSPHAQEVLRAAGDLHGPPAPAKMRMVPRHLFGGILAVEESFAYRALERVVGEGISLEALRTAYPAFLALGPKARFRDFLRERFPARPATKLPPEPPSAAPAERPSPLALVEHEGTAAGVAVAPDLVVTTLEGLTAISFRPEPSTGVTVILADGSRADALVQAFAEETHLALLRIVDLPTSLAAEDIPRPAAERPQPGRRCESLYMTPDGTVTRTTGVLHGIERDRRLVLRFQEQPPSGAPVLDEDGALVGIVWASDGGDTLATSSEVLAEEPFGLKLTEAEAPAEPERDGPLVGTFRGAGNDLAAEEDQLDFVHYVDAFARLIDSPYTEPPLTIGIYGSWGMGKSFLLGHIKKKLESDEFQRRPQPAESPRRPHVHVVLFNAWEYSAAEVIWPGLVRRIMETLEDKIEWGFPGRFLRKLWRNLVRELRVAQGRIVLIAAILLGAFLLAYWAADFSAAAVGAVIAALGVGGLVKLVSDTLTDPLGRWVSKLVEESDYGKQIGYMEQTKRDLDDLSGRLLEDNGRILVLIDDLDRCEPDRAVEVLQAINLLLNFPIFVVCLGIDARVITAAVEKHYEGVLGEAGASGYEYLDKIVQIPFRIPRPSEDEIKAFLAYQLGPELAKDGNGSGSADTAELPELIETEPEPEPEPEPEHEPAGHGTATEEPPSSDLPDTPAHETHRDSGEPEAEFTDLERQAFEAAAPHMRANPRHLKRLVNVYRLVRDLAHSKGERAILDNPAATIRWLVMCAQWPYTAQAMLDRFNELLDEWGGKIPDHPPSGDPLVRLLADVEPSLVLDRLRELDGDLPSLRQLLAWREGELSWAELSRVRHYTVNFNPAVETELRRAMRPTAQTPAPSGNGQTPAQQAATTAS